MSDIVNDLQAFAAQPTSRRSVDRGDALMSLAAADIERLRAGNAQLVEALKALIDRNLYLVGEYEARAAINSAEGNG